MRSSALAAHIRLVIFCLAIAVVALMQSGCSSFGKKLRDFVHGDDTASKPATQTQTRFSDQENVRVTSERKYQRMTKQRFEEEASVNAQSGSLWVMEGQGGYLFAQNQQRMVGDLLNVKIEGGPKLQLQTKAKVIAKLLDKLDRPAPNPDIRGPANTTANKDANAQNPNAQAGAANPNAANPANPGAAQATAAQDPNAPAKPEGPQPPQLVPTRIIEILKDGSYRVRGTQPFMIGKREYKTIVTGVVRAEDFDEAGVDSGKLLESQFDIVGSKKGTTL